MNYEKLYIKYKAFIQDEQLGGSSIEDQIIQLIWFGVFPKDNYTKLAFLRKKNKKNIIMLWICKEITNINHKFLNLHKITIKYIPINNIFFKKNVKVWLDLKDWGNIRYAAASDCWRLYILYHYGGIYTDFSNEFWTIPVEWFQTKNPWFLGDGDKGCYPSLIGSKKKNIIIGNALKFMMKINYKILDTVNNSKQCRWKCICDHINSIILSNDMNKLNNFVKFSKDNYQIYFNNNGRKIKTKWYLGSNLSAIVGNINDCNQEFIGHFKSSTG